MLAAGAEIKFGFLLGARCGIEMGGGKEHFIAAGPEKGTGGFAGAGRDAMTVTAFQIERVNLVERIPWLAFALEDPCASPFVFLF